MNANEKLEDPDDGTEYVWLASNKHGTAIFHYDPDCKWLRRSNRIKRKPRSVFPPGWGEPCDYCGVVARIPDHCPECDGPLNFSVIPSPATNGGDRRVSTAKAGCSVCDYEELFR